MDTRTDYTLGRIRASTTKFTFAERVVKRDSGSAEQSVFQSMHAIVQLNQD